MNVKICGIRSLGTAQEAQAVGATHIGLNFVSESRRCIGEVEATEIARHMVGKIKLVGVFRDMPVEMVNDIAARYELDYIQLHGNETSDYCRQMVRPVIKAIAVRPADDVDEIIDHMRGYPVELFLLDRAVQGEGDVVNMASAREIAAVLPCFVAGGLTAQNVADVVAVTQPFGVDVAGGIEIEGVTDVAKVGKFVRNAQLMKK